MKIRQTEKDGTKYIEPVGNRKEALKFMHCANNSQKVTKRVFDERVKPLLEWHGVMQIEMVKGD